MLNLQLIHNSLQVTVSNFTLHSLNDLSTDLLNASSLGISMGLLAVLLLGEGDHEESECVTISSFHVDMGLNGRLPFKHHSAELIASEVHAMEVGKAVSALNILNLELELSENILGLLIQITEAQLNDTTLKALTGNLSSLSTGNKSASAFANGKQRWGSQFIPLLLGEGIDAITQNIMKIVYLRLLLASLLRSLLRLLFSWSHILKSTLTVQKF